jgi:O-antigen/teichoic acid export membrane protein
MRLASARAHWNAILRTNQKSNEFSKVLRDLAGDSAQYFVGLVLIGLTNTLLLPLYMRYLDPAEFGCYALIEVSSLALIVVSGLGFNTSYLKSYADVDKADSFSLLGSMTVISTAAAGATGTAFAAFVASGTGERLLGTATKPFAYLLMPLVGLESIYASYETHLRASRRPAAISTSAVIRLIAIAGFSIWLMADRQEGLAGLFQGRVLGDMCGVLLAAYYCRRDFTLRISRSLSVAMLRYGTPLVVISLMMLGLDATGRYLLDSYGSLSQVGFYTVGIKISNLMRILFVAPLGAAWGGLMFQIAKKPNARFIYSKLFGYVFLLAGTIALVLALLTPGLFAVFATSAYRPSIALVPWLLLVQVLSILQAPLATGLYVGQATRWLVPIYSAGLAADIAAGRLLVPHYGMYGAAWGWLLGWVVICLLMTMAGQKYYPLQFEWQPIALSLSYCTAVPLVRHLGLLNLEPRSVVLQGLGCILAITAVALYAVRDVRKSHATFEIGFSVAEELGNLVAESD